MEIFIKTAGEVLPDMAQVQVGMQGIREVGLHISNLSVEGLIATAVLGVIIGLLGLRLVNFFMGFLGLIIGFMIGYTVGVGFGAPELVALAIGVVLGIFIAILSIHLYRMGAFILCFVLGISTSAALIQPESMIFVIVCVVIGVVAGAIAVKLADPMIVVCTAVGGGLSAGVAIAELTGFTGWYFAYMIGGVLIVIGLIIQFLYASQKVNKKSVAKAQEIRAEKSVENEVEAARAILDQPEVAQEEEIKLND